MVGMTRVLVVDNYDSFVFTIVGYLEQLGAECEVVRNDAVAPADAAELRRRPRLPGPGTPEEAGVSMAMIEGCAEPRSRCSGCAWAPGAGRRDGRDRRPGPRAAARQDLAGAPRRHRGARGRPDPFTATRYHSLTIDPATLPDELVATAAPSRASSWPYGTPRCRCTACSSTPSRCSPTAGTGCSPPGSSCAGCRMPSSARSASAPSCTTPRASGPDGRRRLTRPRHPGGRPRGGANRSIGAGGARGAAPPVGLGDSVGVGVAVTVGAGFCAMTIVTVLPISTLPSRGSCSMTSPWSTVFDSRNSVFDSRPAALRQPLRLVGGLADDVGHGAPCRCRPAGRSWCPARPRCRCRGWSR